MKLKHRGRWGWGIYGLNGWGIYDLNGCGIYDLNGWGHLWLKWMGRLVTVFGRYAQKKNTGLQGSTLSGPRMTTGFGPFELWSFKLCCEILLLLNVAESDMDCVFYVEGCGVGSAEYRVHLVSV